MAYRGRVLVELQTKLNAKCQKQSESVSQADILKVQVSDPNTDDITLKFYFYLISL